MEGSDPQAEAPEKPNLGGRPEKVIDLGELKRVCALHPTIPEIAAAFEVGVTTIERRMRDDPEFREIVERGREQWRLVQRRAFNAAVQRTVNGAMERGDASLVLLAAKQPERIGGLGFKDRHEHDVRAEVRSWSDLVAAEAAGEGAPLAGELEGDGDGEA